MKKIFLGSMILCVSVISASAQTNAATQQPAAKTTNAAAPAIAFKDPENTYNFGSIPQGTPVTHEFVFTNTGKAPLVLGAPTTSCGCTVAEMPKDAIAPGKSASIKVTYNAAALNTFERTVTVASNASNGSVVLHIKGDVKAPATNASAQPSASAPVQSAGPKKN